MRVLVVEGDPQAAGLPRRGLADDSFVVDAARNGPEGLSRAPELEYDVPCRPEKNQSQMSKKWCMEREIMTKRFYLGLLAGMIFVLSGCGTENTVVEPKVASYVQTPSPRLAKN